MIDIGHGWQPTGALWVKPCNGCADVSMHSHHLTWYGRWYFSGFNPRWWFK